MSVSVQVKIQSKICMSHSFTQITEITCKTWNEGENAEDVTRITTDFESFLCQYNFKIYVTENVVVTCITNVMILGV